MKPIVLLLVIFFAGLAGAGVVGYLSFTPGQPTGEAPPSRAAPQRTAATSERRSSDFEALQAEVAMISGRLGALESEIARRSGETARRPARAEEVEAEASAGAAQASLEATFTPQDRQVVLDILDSVREEERERRAEDRLARDEARVADRAAAIARELGLSLADQNTLADHLLVASQKRGAMMDQVREEGFDPMDMRDNFLALRDWNEEQLDLLFGPDLADQIGAYDRESRGGFGRGGRGGGRGVQVLPVSPRGN